MHDPECPQKSHPVLKTFFVSLKDPRRTEKGHFRYPLDEILFLVIAGALSGADGWASISIFGRAKLAWLRQFMPYRNGTPSHDVLGKLFALIDPVQFNSCFMAWASSVLGNGSGEVVAIDGKSLRGSDDRAGGRPAFHMVSAYATRNRLCLGQQCVAGKGNEITAIPILLDSLDIKGCTVTADAMGCQQDIASKVLERGANYILMVKDNQEGLRQQVEKVFSISLPSSSHSHIDTGHGRMEKRVCDVIGDLRFLDDRELWQGLTSIVRVRSERHDKQTGASSGETRYYISSLAGDAEGFNEKVRSHWAIENNLHWQLDVIFNEDDLLMKKGNSAVNFSMVNKMALAILEREKSTKMSKPSKRLRAALDDEYRTLLIKS